MPTRPGHPRRRWFATVVIAVVALIATVSPATGAGAATDPVLIHGPDQGSVERLYRAYFLRTPETSGLSYWRSRRMGGTPLTSVSAHFAVSQEFVTRYGHLTDSEFVRRVYANVLSRQPDPGGLAHWTARLARHPDARGSIMLGFSDSPEYKSLTGTAGGCDLGGPGPGSPYSQICFVAGVQILASGAVDPTALHRAADLLYGVLGPRPTHTAAMAGARVFIAGQREPTSSVPALWTYLDRTGGRFNDQVRGVWIPDLQATFVGEENLLCRASDAYEGESVLLHEFAHGLHMMAMPRVDPSFGPRLDDAYASAKAAGTWGETYASSSVHEYFAEGVQSYFDANKHGSGGLGLHGPNSTRAALKAADPVLHDLVHEVYGEPRWTMPC